MRLFKNLSEAGVEIDKNTRNNWQVWKEKNPNGIVAFRIKHSNGKPIWQDPKEVEKHGMMGNPFMGWLNNGDKTRDTKSLIVGLNMAKYKVIPLPRKNSINNI